MNQTVMLILSMSMSLMGSMSRKFYSQKTTGSMAGILWNSIICSGVSAVMLCLLGALPRCRCLPCAWVVPSVL